VSHSTNNGASLSTYTLAACVCERIEVLWLAWVPTECSECCVEVSVYCIVSLSTELCVLQMSRVNVVHTNALRLCTTASAACRLMGTDDIRAKALKRFTTRAWLVKVSSTIDKHNDSPLQGPSVCDCVNPALYYVLLLVYTRSTVAALLALFACSVQHELLLSLLLVVVLGFLPVARIMLA
jgi:hypothetical protein